jgi:hypothetical protein
MRLSFATLAEIVIVTGTVGEPIASSACMEEKLPSIPPRTNKEDIILFLLIAIVLSTVLLARLSG